MSEKEWGVFASGALGGGVWFKLSIWPNWSPSPAQLTRLIEKLKLDRSFAEEDENCREMVAGDL